MDTEVIACIDDVNSADQESESSKVDLIVEMSSNGEITSELGIADRFLTRMELNLACASEKLINLNILMMHVATKESEFETITSPVGDSLEALEFDLLSGILDSELTEMDKFMITSQENIIEVRHMISSYEHSGEIFVAMEEKLFDSEKSLEKLQDQISEIREQSDKFRKTLLCLTRDENWHGNEGSNGSEDGQSSDMNTKIKLQTAEQRRHFLRMLEKSLARELDLEYKLTESRNIEEELKNRLISTEQEVFFMEEEAVEICEKCFTAENAAEILKGISQGLLSKLQILQFNLNGTNQREIDLRSKLEKCMEQLETKENALQEVSSSSAKLSNSFLSQTGSLKASLIEAEDKLLLANSEALALKEKLNLLEKQLDGPHLKVTSEKVDYLEKQLRESEVQLQHAVASVDASQEKQNMLYATVRDMENLIEDLKLKVLKAENRADSADDKCITLSESNAELTEELGFLRGKLVSLEASLNRTEETKMTTARDIGIRTKVITDLVMQLAIERERLHKQITSLALDNRTLVVKLQQSGIAPFVASSHLQKGNGEKHLFSEHEKTHIPAPASKIS
ncbi:WPP domain-interacting tail-anchored protein 1 isoform X2 [Mercurialis annua]|uniref:WPP domain-interacting tail-anchored protein 1 isoform X2 n=1 Tax=Mercurialis annua TaxID=3986 RepID=UPI0024AC9ED8|nr:WPP domain-interacting tail-anchored protein 1 isoform X2 [Mercurialis annua]